MISAARFGPDSTAIRPALTPVTSAMTSLARFPVSTSMPFISDTITAPLPMCGAHTARLARKDCEGMESTR
jgi:hypothetical protein